MRLLTHNAMRNNTCEAVAAIKAASNKKKGGMSPSDYDRSPVLSVSSVKSVEVRETEPNLNFISRILPTLDWAGLVQAASSLGISTLPPALTEDIAKDHDFLTALHRMLMDVHLMEGTLKCSLTGREFIVSNGIVDFMLQEEECEKVSLKR
eukprot:CAMPEP_0194279874 /NCGR_PEP_ID=MMETSP0169-20130528/14176_1 /TAXON_ID=218684 /ORGANISM="Corethron pennatum, Strain L29A3" /LENGTH=150 /DNA_ID=CAMNT_0039024351 /DNA_START=76 /DNA_END=528 /DNA_ORIENTATION=+